MNRFFRVLTTAVFVLGGAARAEAPTRPLKFLVAHKFSRAEAHARVEQLLTYWRGRFGVKADWEGDRARVTGVIRGIHIDAIVDVNEGAVGGEASDPGFFLRSRAYSYIEKKLLKYLHPSYMEP